MDTPSPAVSAARVAEPKYTGAPVRMIVLAGRDPRGTDALARSFGKTHKCLVPLAGRPLVAHVLQTAAVHPAIESLAISVEREAFEGLFDVLSQLPGRGIAKLVEARENLVDSVLAAAEGWEGPVLVTTADHALLTPASIDTMIAAMANADAAFAMAPRDAVLAAHPQHLHPFLEFADGAYASCNLYAAADPEALRAVEVFRGGGRFAGNAWGVLRAFGFVNLALLSLRAASLFDAATRVSRRIGQRLAPVVLHDGSQALDVDDAATHAAAEALLAQRPEPARAAVGTNRSRQALG